MISIILPTYNEAGNIAILVERIARSLTKTSHQIIVVDDNSPDKTWQIAQKLRKKFPQLTILRRLNERGLTSALSAGIQASKGEYVGWMDADLSHPPELLATMVSAIKHHDVVVASRYIKGADDQRGLWLQVKLSRLINKLCHWLLYRQATDYTSGYILLKKSYFKKLNLRGDYGEYFIRLISDLNLLHAHIHEIPYINVNRVYGQSKTATNLWGLIVRGRKYLFAMISLWLKKYF